MLIMLTARVKVWHFALYSRLFLLALSAVFNLLIPDHAADAFISPLPYEPKECFVDRVLKILFGGLLRWDAQYFWHIAHYGYTFEHVLAFFPLFPLNIRALTWPVDALFCGSLNKVSLFLICAVLLNITCFVKSASLLYELSLRVLKNEKLAYRSAILYCVNPASVFFIAPYSETLYAFLTFYGMLKCGSGISTKFSGCGTVFGLAVLTRSNGLLNIGFIAYKCLTDTISYTIPQLLAHCRLLRVHWIFMSPPMLPILLFTLIPYLLSSVVILVWFAAFQSFAYLKFCLIEDHVTPFFLIHYGITHNFVLPGRIPDFSLNNNIHWCNRSLPISYSYIQSFYWNVGFLKYYQFKQIPNFLLALPVVCIILNGSLRFTKTHLKYIMFLGLRGNTKPPAVRRSQNYEILTIPENALPYVVHAVFFTVFCVLCVNVQVTTRLIASSSPVLYWFASVLMEDKRIDDIDTIENMESKWKVFVLTETFCTKAAKFIQLLFLSYTVIGILLFCNFYPWT